MKGGGGGHEQVAKQLRIQCYMQSYSNQTLSFDRLKHVKKQQYALHNLECLFYVILILW